MNRMKPLTFQSRAWKLIRTNSKNPFTVVRMYRASHNLDLRDALALAASSFRRNLRAQRVVRPTSRYLLPDGRIVNIFEDVARGQYFISFTLENGRIVSAIRLPPAKSN